MAWVALNVGMLRLHRQAGWTVSTYDKGEAVPHGTWIACRGAR